MGCCDCVSWCGGSKVKRLLPVHKIEVRTSDVKIKDNWFVVFKASVEFRALSKKAEDAFNKLRDTKNQIIEACVSEVICATVLEMELDAVFAEDNTIAETAEQELKKTMPAYGYEIVGTLRVHIFDFVHRAAPPRVATNDKVKAEEIPKKKKAKGEAIMSNFSGPVVTQYFDAVIDFDDFTN